MVLVVTLVVVVVVVVVRTVGIGPEKILTLVDAKDTTIVDKGKENLCKRARREVGGPG